jgi:methyl-accepting chemotaxis protein
MTPTPPRPAEPAPGLADPGLLPLEGQELAAAHLGGLADVVAVLSEQLDGVQAQTAEAALGIVTRTNGIEQQLRGLIGLVEKEAAHQLEGSAEEGLRLREEQGALAMLERFLDRSASHAHDGEERARRIGAAVASAQPVITELRQLAMQSKVLSINAGVESARQRGAFGVIAQEVRRVSERSSAAVKQVESAIGQVAALVGGQLSDTTRQQQQQDDSDRAQLKRFAELVARRADEQHQRDGERHRLMESVAQQHDQLRGNVVELLASVQFEDVTRQRVEGVREALADMERVLQGLVSALRTPAGWADLPAVLDGAQLLERYVMAQQREAHVTALGGKAEADGEPKIELF